MEIKLIITFGSNHLDIHGRSLANKYTVVQGESYVEARAAAFALRGPKFSFDYLIAGGEQLVEDWNMVEVSNEDVDILGVKSA